MSDKVYPVLMYHSICKMPKGTPMRSLHVPSVLFRLHMRTLKFLGYRGISMSELLPYLRGEKTGKVVGITFDDGYLNNLQNALPILKEFNFSATCYLLSENINGNNYWDLDKGIPELRTMSTMNIREWISSGMEIGSHGKHHVHLSRLSESDSKKEIMESKAALEKIFGCPVLHFCYPYGNFNDTTLDIVKSSGYATATTVSRGRALKGGNLFQIPRIFITHRTFLHLFLLKLFTSYEDRKKE